MAVYRLDPGQGRFTVQAFATGMLSRLGHSPTLAAREFDGRIVFDPANPADASLEVNVHPASLAVIDDMSRSDCREIESRTRAEVLETATYPEIVYRAAQITVGRAGQQQYRLHARGRLHLHGVERELPLDLDLRLGESSLRLSGECRLRQSDFHIERVSAVMGAIRVKDDVKLAFELGAIKQDPTEP